MRNLILTAMLAMASLFGMAAQADDYTAGKEYVELSSPVISSTVRLPSLMSCICLSR